MLKGPADYVGIVLAISDPTVEKYSLKAFAICFEFVILVLSTSTADGLVTDDCLRVTNSFIPFQIFFLFHY